VQPWHDEDSLRHFALTTRWHAALAPYLAHVSAEAQRSGVGMMRPLCLHNPDPRWRDKRDAWYLGDDMLVFPVLRPGVTRMRVEIPEGAWVRLLGGGQYGAGAHRVDCPIGRPAVFYRRGSAFEPVFAQAGAA